MIETGALDVDMLGARRISSLNAQGSMLKLSARECSGKVFIARQMTPK